MIIVALPLLFSTLVTPIVSSSTPLLVRAAEVPPDHEVLLTRFIDRSRLFRRIGLMAGMLLMFGGWFVLDAEVDGGLDASIGFLPVACIGLAGSIAGSVCAEVFRLRRPEGARVASLAARDPDEYDDPVRSEERRGGNEGVSTCSSRWSPIHKQKKTR